MHEKNMKTKTRQVLIIVNYNNVLKLRIIATENKTRLYNTYEFNFIC